MKEYQLSANKAKNATGNMPTHFYKRWKSHVESDEDLLSFHELFLSVKQVIFNFISLLLFLIIQIMNFLKHLVVIRRSAVTFARKKITNSQAKRNRREKKTSREKNDKRE